MNKKIIINNINIINILKSNINKKMKNNNNNNNIIIIY